MFKAVAAVIVGTTAGVVVGAGATVFAGIASDDFRPGIVHGLANKIERFVFGETRSLRTVSPYNPYSSRDNRFEPCSSNERR